MSETKFEPLVPVTLYQARCTSCGLVEEDYGDFSCMDADAVTTYVCDNGWFERTRDEPTPTPENPHRKVVHTVELLCPDCQRCDVCGAERCYPDESDEHLVCEQHEDHDFSAVPA